MKQRPLIIGLLLLLLGVGHIFSGASPLVAAAETNALPTTPQPAAKVPAAKGKPLPSVRVETLKPQPMRKTLNQTGNVTATRTARMASPGEGPVAACPGFDCMVREGDRVTKGQSLMRIGRNKTAEALLAAAKQTLAEHETELLRMTQLVEGGAVPGAQLDIARSATENARAQYAKALESADDYEIIAPWDGIVAMVHVTEGDYVAPRATLLELFDPNSLVVQFAVAEAQAIEVRRGLSLKIQFDAYPGKNFAAQVSRVYPQLDGRLRTRTLEATLQDPLPMIPGMFARIELVLAEFPQTLSVPVEAILYNPEEQALVFVVEEGKAHKREVQLGIEDQGRMQVVKGLHTGEQVVVAGYEKLKEGAAVKVLTEQSR